MQFVQFPHRPVVSYGRCTAHRSGSDGRLCPGRFAKIVVHFVIVSSVKDCLCLLDVENTSVDRRIPQSCMKLANRECYNYDRFSETSDTCTSGNRKSTRAFAIYKLLEKRSPDTSIKQ